MNPTPHIESRHYSVQGMTCAHCVMSVREEVGEVAGVASVDVDLGSGALTVTGSSLDDGAIRAAVTDAGYEANRSGSRANSAAHASEQKKYAASA
jgi:copper chaperone